MPKTELYVGNLNRDVTRKDIEAIFDKYGNLLRCDLKNRGFGSIYAFLEFEKTDDAEDALKTENGKELLGSAMLVEWAKAKSDRRDRDRFSGRNSFRDRDRRSLECYECGERGHFARDCRNRGSGGGYRGGRDRDSRRDRDRSRSRTRSRDRRRRDSDRDRRDRERRRSRSRTRSRSTNRRSRSRSTKKRSSRSRSGSHERSKRSH